MPSYVQNIVDLDPAPPPAGRSRLDDNMVVHITDLAKLLGVTERRIRQLCEEGMPRCARGLHPLLTSVQWYQLYLQRRAGAVARRDPDELRYRRARAESAEFKLQLMQSKAIPKIK